MIKRDPGETAVIVRTEQQAATCGVSGGGVTAPGHHTGQWSPPELALSSSQAVESLQLHAGWV